MTASEVLWSAPGAVPVTSGPSLAEWLDEQTFDVLLHDPGACRAVPGAMPVRIGEDGEHLRIARQIRGARHIMVLGGGSAIDLVKLAAVVAGGGRLRWSEAGRSGLALVGAGPGPRPAVAAVPTTFGTGAEVSSVARARLPDGRSRLVWSPLLRPRQALLDPGLLVPLAPPARGSGTLELLLRLIGPLLGPRPLHLTAEAWTLGLAERVLEAGDAALSRTRPDTAALRRLGALSAVSQQCWPLVGRSPFAFLLWYLADTAAVVGGVPKMAAMARLAPYYAALVVSGRSVSAWGDAGRARRVARALFGTGTACGVEDAMRSLYRRWQVPVADRLAPAEELAREALLSWPRALDGLGRRELAEFYGRCP
ncbi:iron-containing alcohol dehydrogenase [Actinomadura sp. DSM 109109]|nr:iron-containing alcohol dehydrogenase [Actinomadura lepetitiana]